MRRRKKRLVARPHVTLEHHTSVSEAFEATAAERAACSDKDLVDPNFDVMEAAIRAIGIDARLHPFRERIAELAPTFDLGLLDRVPLYARAALHAEVRLSFERGDEDELGAVYAEARALRDTLDRDLEALVKRGLVHVGARAKRKRYVGYLRVAEALQLDAMVARDHFPAIEGRTVLTLAELDRAEEIATRLLYLVGRRGKLTDAQREARHERRRAITLLFRGYQAIRRVIAYVRWDEGDADQLVPSLHRTKHRRVRNAREDATADTGAAGASPAASLAE